MLGLNEIGFDAFFFLWKIFISVYITLPIV